MALSQFGGRGGSSSGGGSAREIGEMVQVPSTFEHESYVDGGTVITQSSHPTLFDRISGASTPSSYSSGGAVGDVSSVYVDDIVNVPVATIVVGSELIQIHATGVVSSMDTSNVSTFRGAMPTIVKGLAIGNYLRGTVHAVHKAGRILVHATPTLTNGTGISLYSDDLGATWTAADGFVYSGFRTFVATSSYFVMFQMDTRVAMRSTDGITWSSFTHPAGTNASAMTSVSVYADPTTSNIIVVSGADSKHYFSNDHGTSWSNTAMVAGTTTNISNITFFTDGLFFTGISGVALKAMKSTDGGATWTQISSAANNAAGSPLAMTLGVQSGRLVLFGGSAAAGSGGLGSTTSGNVLYSATGATWTATNVTAGTSTTLVRCSFFADKIIGYLTNSKPYAVSTTANPIVASLINTTYTCYKSSANLFSYLVATPTRLFAFSNTTSTSEFRYTDDGVVWSTGTLPSAVTITSAAFDSVNGTLFVARTGTTCFATHDLGSTWVTQPLGNISATRIFKGANSVVMAAATTGARVITLGSTVAADGTYPVGNSFSNVALAAYSNAYDCVGYHKGFVANSSTASQITSWQNIEDTSATTITLTFTPLVFGVLGNTAVAIGASKYAYCITPDKAGVAASWTEGNLPASAAWNVVLTTNESLIVMATGTTTAITGDGTAWTLFDMTLPSGDIGSAAYFESKVYVVSSNSNEFFTAVPSTTKVVPTIASPLAGTKYVIKAE